LAKIFLARRQINDAYSTASDFPFEKIRANYLIGERVVFVGKIKLSREI
jgi:hypothetical protein